MTRAYLLPCPPSTRISKVESLWYSKSMKMCSFDCMYVCVSVASPRLSEQTCLNRAMFIHLKGAWPDFKLSNNSGCS